MERTTKRWGHRTRASSQWVLGAALCALGAYTQHASAGGVIFNNIDPALQTIALGVNDFGHLNFQSDTVFTVNSGPFGLAARFDDGQFYDATSPGCLCEGWGVAGLFGGSQISGSANENDGISGLTGGLFGYSTTSATSTVGLASAALITITHAYGVSLAPNVFQGNVTITNGSDQVLRDLVYRRVMDWDVPPTEFNEYVSHFGVAANLEAMGGNVRFASNNGFASADPTISADSIDVNGFDSTNVDFQDLGVADHGSVFDFSLNDLAAGESRTFNIFYGAASNEAAANDAIAVLNPDVWAYGQSALNLPVDECGEECSFSESGVEGSSPSAAAIEGPSPNNDGVTFIFAFGGVGGIEPGTDPDHPLLPFVPAPGVFEFPDPTPRRWYDPPFADGFEYTLEEGAFLSVMIDDGFGELTLEVGDMSFALTGLVEFVLADAGLVNVMEFRITGIPLLDVGAPDFSTAFPTFLDFTAGASGFSMTALTVQAVPVPAALPLMLSGVGLLAWRRRRRA